MHSKYDFIIVGAGIVGLATACELQRRNPRARILLLEKESRPAQHQTGRNSGVIHAGVYYESGSLKARFCREGAEDTYAFCRRHTIPARRIGKLLVVTGEKEFPAAEALFQRCRDNGLKPEWLDAGQLRSAEPAVRGVAAILVAESGITSYPAICAALLDQFRERGGNVAFRARVTGITERDREVRVDLGNQQRHADRLVVCAGLLADRLAQLQGLGDDFRIVPYRGEYYRLRPGLQNLVRRLIYPIPDPALPFLGIHLTPMIDETTTIGPNAVQGWKREGYGRFNFSLTDTASLLGFAGTWKVAARHWRHGLAELRDATWKGGYLRRVQRYCPQLTAADLLPHPVGIRAQAVLRDGTLIHDFLLRQSERCLHVCNAPSPAATSAFPIARHICKLLLGD